MTFIKFTNRKPKIKREKTKKELRREERKFKDHLKEEQE